MEMIPPVKVKICCIASREEARLAISYGAAAIGMVDETPSGEGQVPLPEIAEIVRETRPGIGTFLLTSARDVDRLEELHRVTGVNTLQLFDGLASEDYGRLRRRAPRLSLVQSIHVRDESAVECAQAVSRHVDAICLDSADPEPPFRWKSPGGQTHDWEISRRIVQAVQTPVILAGGLTPENVCRAIRMVRPFGVDVCSGVRSGGRLDQSLLVAFLESVSRMTCNA